MGKKVNCGKGANWLLVEPPISSIFHVSWGSTTGMIEYCKIRALQQTTDFSILTPQPLLDVHFHNELITAFDYFFPFLGSSPGGYQGG